MANHENNKKDDTDLGLVQINFCKLELTLKSENQIKACLEQFSIYGFSAIKQDGCKLIVERVHDSDIPCNWLFEIMKSQRFETDQRTIHNASTAGKISCDSCDASTGLVKPDDTDSSNCMTTFENAHGADKSQSEMVEGQNDFESKQNVQGLRSKMHIASNHQDRDKRKNDSDSATDEQEGKVEEEEDDDEDYDDEQHKLEHHNHHHLQKQYKQQHESKVSRNDSSQDVFNVSYKSIERDQIESACGIETRKGSNFDQEKMLNKNLTFLNDENEKDSVHMSNSSPLIANQDEETELTFDVDIERFKLVQSRFSGTQHKSLLNNCVQNDTLDVLKLPKCENSKVLIEHIEGLKTIRRPFSEDKSDIMLKLDTTNKHEFDRNAIMDTKSGEVSVTGPKDVLDEIYTKIDETSSEMSSGCKPNEHKVTALDIGSVSSSVVENKLNTMIFQGKKNGQIMIHISKANITELHVDVLVSASSVTLKNSGGVAKAIRQGAGEHLQKECDDYIHTHKNLGTTQVHVTTAGNLHAKKVFHVVGPKWKDFQDKRKCAETLRHSVLRCLGVAARPDVRSIALPSISADTYGVPKEVCAENYMKAVKHFDHMTKYTSVNKILFVDINADMVQEIEKAFLQNWHVEPNKEEMMVDFRFLEKHLQDKKVMPEIFVIENPFKRPQRLTSSRLTTDSSSSSVDPNISDLTKRFNFGHCDVIVQAGNSLAVPTDLIIILGDENKLTNSDHQKVSFLKAKGFPSSSGNFEFLNGKTSSTVYPVLLKLKNSDGNKLCCQIPQKIKAVLEKCLQKQNVLRDVKKISISSDSFFPDSGQAKHSITTEMIHKLVECCYSIIKEVTTFQDLSVQTVKLITSAETFEATSSAFEHQLKRFPINEEGKLNKPSSFCENEEKEEQCEICAEERQLERLGCCSKRLCQTCKEKVDRCPFCQYIFKTIRGDMPSGCMTVEHMKTINTPGYKSKGTFKIIYDIPAGVQKDFHRSPGKGYKRLYRTAYLPADTEGQELLMLLGLAFLRRLTFSISVSNTKGTEGLVWNDIHHKTHLNQENYGYPDAGYLKRLRDELTHKGVTKESMNLDEIKEIKRFEKESALRL